jgi:hypothetical protein
MIIRQTIYPVSGITRKILKDNFDAGSDSRMLFFILGANELERSGITVIPHQITPINGRNSARSEFAGKLSQKKSLEHTALITADRFKRTSEQASEVVGCQLREPYKTPALFHPLAAQTICVLYNQTIVVTLTNERD